MEALRNKEPFSNPNEQEIGNLLIHVFTNAFCIEKRKCQDNQYCIHYANKSFIEIRLYGDEINCDSSGGVLQEKKINI